MNSIIHRAIKSANHHVGNKAKRNGSFRLTVVMGTITLVSIFAGLTGCSGFFQAVISNPTGNGVTSFAYIIHSGGTLAEYSLSSGVLAPLTGSPVTLPVTPTAIAVSPNNAFVYIGTGTGVFLYTINSDGTLTEGNSNTIIYLNTAIATPVIRSMVVDSTSSWLIIAYQASTEVDAVPIDPTSGLPTTASAFIVNTSAATPSPSLAIAPANNLVIATLGAGGTDILSFNPKASASPWDKVTPIPTLSTNSADTAASIDPASAYLFVAEANNATAKSAGSVRMFNITTGAELTGSPYAVGVNPQAVLADLSGAFVYVANQADGTISGFSLDKTSQTLSNLGSSSTATDFPTGASPIALVEDHSKAYIMAVGSGVNPDLWLYNFDSTTNNGTLDVKTTTSTSSTSPALANGIAVTF
jgi:6-phosphogluconolactonase